MRIWICLLLIACTLACTDNQKIPEGIIGKDKMEKILWDMVQADRYVNYYVKPKRDAKFDPNKESAQVYARVFKIHGITKDEFIKSYKFYLSRPDITKVLFDSISAQAERRRSEVYTTKSRNPILEKRDSLRRVDSLRKADTVKTTDSVGAADSSNTSELSDSALRELLYK